MAVTHEDVGHVAELARIDVPPDRLDSLVTELNGILGHMEALSQVDTTGVDRDAERDGATFVESTPTRSDSSGPLPLLSPRESFAPAIKDGFFLVPRLATHHEVIDESDDRSP